VYCSSADWMPRNFRRRVETMFPILDANLRGRVIHEILETMRRDNSTGWLLRADGNYEQIVPGDGEPIVHSQQRFTELARERAREDTPILSTGKGVEGTDAGALVQLARKVHRKRRRSDRER
jgi:polyphosphate kinase